MEDFQVTQNVEFFRARDSSLLKHSMWQIIFLHASCASHQTEALTPLATKYIVKTTKWLARLRKNKADITGSLFIEIALESSFYKSALQKS